jgi:hypothetical protein
MIGPAEKMSDLKDRGELPDPDDRRFYLEIDRDKDLAVICFVEPLRFHAEHNGNDWAPLVDENGALKLDVANRIADRLRDLIKSQGHVAVGVDLADYLEHDDEPSFGLEIVTDYQKDETFQHWLDRIGWPAIATVINVTDPGTFNSPYLFGASALR